MRHKRGESVTVVLGDAFVVIWLHVRCQGHEENHSRECAVFAKAWRINRSGHAQNNRLKSMKWQAERLHGKNLDKKACCKVSLQNAQG